LIILAEMKQKVCAKYPIIFLQLKTTISAAWNAGIDHSSGDYFLFLDSDMELRPNLLEEMVQVIIEQSVDCIQMDFECAESRKASFINVVEARNIELKMGAAPTNIYLYSRKIVGDNRYPVDAYQIVGEEYIFRQQILDKNPKTGKVKTITLHYYDPRFFWLARRCLKYGKWFVYTKRYLKSGSAIKFIQYNSIFKKKALKEIALASKNKPRCVPSVFLYFIVKYTSFIVGYLSG
jgi:glycosyltransferase involved in cell wall biosynthesis